MTNIKIHKIVVGPLYTNCYLVVGEQSKECIIIDPGDEAEKIIAVIEENNLRPKQIILTHPHFDHVGALEEIKNHYKIPESTTKTVFVANDVKIIETPGHTEDGICIVFEKEKVIFTGDTLFKNTIGRTDLEGGDYNKIMESLEKLKKYPDDFKVYPGHGRETTIGEEKQNNPFLNDSF